MKINNEIKCIKKMKESPKRIYVKIKSYQEFEEVAKRLIEFGIYEYTDRNNSASRFDNYKETELKIIFSYDVLEVFKRYARVKHKTVVAFKSLEIETELYTFEEFMTLDLKEVFKDE